MPVMAVVARSAGLDCKAICSGCWSLLNVRPAVVNAGPGTHNSPGPWGPGMFVVHRWLRGQDLNL